MELLKTGLRMCLPPDTAIDVRGVEDHCDSLYPVELDCIANAVPPRRWDFSTGRICARTAMRTLGSPPRPIPMGTYRAPQWPAGFSGSITHHSDIAIAVVRRGAEGRGVGVDLATAEPLPPEVKHLICTDDELADGSLSSLSTADPWKLLFSAKEALYKAIHPTVGRYVDFREVSIRVYPGAGAWRPRFLSADLEAAIDFRVEGRFHTVEEHILTTAWYG
jgi:4'-phosphopantetheinyl transferase EntD